MRINHRVVVFDAADLDIEDAHATVTRLGATLLKPAEDGPAPDDFQVCSDRAGHPFCLCLEQEQLVSSRAERPATRSRGPVR